jgi:ABC-type uncharacterized transport system involved in gliding motility auxiliary subunit
MGILFAIFGVVLILFGLVALFLGTPFWAAGQFALGLVCVVIAAVSGVGQFQEIWRRDATRRGLKYGGNAALQTLLIGFILVVVAFISVRHPKHWDWTESRMHSLTAGSVEVLEQIPEDVQVEILGFYVQGGQATGRQVLELYGYESDRVKVKIYDPNRRPDLAQRFEIRTDGVLIVCKGSCESASGSVRVPEADEAALTKAIRSVISERKTVYFLSGHGEGDIEDQEARGYSRVKLALEDENIAAKSLLLANQENVPEDADGVVVVGPDHSLLERELDALDRYLRGGGGVLVMADPIVVSNLEDQVRDWGVQLGADIIIDQQIQLFAGPQLGVQPVATAYGAHPITEDLATRRSPTLFQLARSVSAAESTDTDQVVELVKTGQASWAETDINAFVSEGRVGLDPDSDRQGPVAIAAAAEVKADAEADAEAPVGRLVVIGDADFASNRYVAEFFNVDLFLNSVDWIVGEEAFMSIERKRPRASTVIMTAGQVETFQFLAIFILPELVLLLGILNWWVRRT